MVTLIFIWYSDRVLFKTGYFMHQVDVERQNYLRFIAMSPKKQQAEKFTLVTNETTLNNGTINIKYHSKRTLHSFRCIFINIRTDRRNEIKIKNKIKRKLYLKETLININKNTKIDEQI